MKSLKEILVHSPETKYRIGVCLSGGGALGFAHIGVLQALEDYHIMPDVVSGSSMGSIIGAIYAAGYTPAQMLQFIKEGNLYKVTNVMHFKPTFWKGGLSNHDTIFSVMNEFIPGNSFEKLEKLLFVCVSNLTTGEWEVISSSEKLNMWIAASCSIPGIFKALEINKMMYVDGGLLNNVPSQPLRSVCEYVIGCDVLPHLSDKRPFKMRDTIVESIRVGQHQNSQPGRKLCDFLIEPEAIKKFHEFSFDSYQSIYQIGYRSAVQFITKNPDILKLRVKKEK
ncbi:MAG: patatin-like phospholipase family protein [Paludibacteraceae bacterium]